MSNQTVYDVIRPHVEALSPEYSAHYSFKDYYPVAVDLALSCWVRQNIEAEELPELAERIFEHLQRMMSGKVGTEVPYLLRNHYRCPDCGHEWADEWDSAPDDPCPECEECEPSPYASGFVEILGEEVGKDWVFVSRVKTLIRLSTDGGATFGAVHDGDEFDAWCAAHGVTTDLFAATDDDGDPIVNETVIRNLSDHTAFAFKLRWL